MNYLDKVTIAMPSGAGFGWGVCGTELAKRLPNMGAKVYTPSGNYGVDKIDGTLLQAIGSHEFSYTVNAIGCKQVGYGFIENNILAGKFSILANRIWDQIIAGSEWMASNIDFGNSSFEVDVCIQGVNTSVFNYNGYNPKLKGLGDGDEFVVGSFGKFEYRKAQDIVIKAFKLFKLRHPEVKLVTSWGNPWSQTCLTMNQAEDSLVKGITEEQNYSELLASEGIGKGAYKGYNGSNSPEFMAWLYRSCDVGLFPNRCEAGTNLCLMEALACGLPCIATNATGHADIVGREDYPCDELNLNGGKEYVANIGGVEVGDWHTPCMDEILSNLEYAYINRDELKKRRKAVSEFGSQFTWDKSAMQMANILQ